MSPKQEESLPPERPAQPPSAGRALKILLVAVGGPGLWLLLMKWYSSVGTAAHVEYRWFWNVVELLGSAWTWLVLAGNYVAFRWVTRPLWQLPPRHRSPAQRTVLRLGLMLHGVSWLLYFLSWVLLFLLRGSWGI